MGLGDIANTVLTKYKADTSDHKREIKKLRGAERKAHKERLQELEDHNAKLDAQIETWQKVAVGIGAVAAAGAVLYKGYEKLEERTRLVTAASGANLDKLKEATSGLVSETRLLEFASKAMNGTFKLSHQEMEQALQGALALRKTLGVDLERALEVTQKAITEGTVEPLKELGLVIKDVENDTREGLNAALAELSEQARQAGGDLALPGDSMTESAVAMRDAMDKLMVSLGELAVKLAPVVSMFAELVGYIADAVSFATSVGDMDPDVVAEMRRRVDRGFVGGAVAQIQGNLQEFQDRSRAQSMFSSFNKQRADARAEQRSMDARGYMASMIKQAENAPNRKRGSGGGTVDYSGSVVQSSQERRELNALMLQAINAKAGFQSLGDYSADSSGVSSDEIKSIQESFSQMAADFQAMDLAQNQTMLSSMFGPLSEFNAYATGFEMLTGAATAAFDAWITGAESIGTAFKRAIGESLRSLASQMLIESLKHTAYAIGSLAFGDVRGAGTHAVAAAKFGAGALAAGIAARHLGAGQAASPSSTAGVAGVGSGGGTSTSTLSGNSTKVFILGESFGGMSSRERESRFRQMGRAAGMTFEGDVIQDG